MIEFVHIVPMEGFAAYCKAPNIVRYVVNTLDGATCEGCRAVVVQVAAYKAPAKVVVMDKNDRRPPLGAPIPIMPDPNRKGPLPPPDRALSAELARGLLVNATLEALMGVLESVYHFSRAQAEQLAVHVPFDEIVFHSETRADIADGLLAALGINPTFDTFRTWLDRVRAVADEKAQALAEGKLCGYGYAGCDCASGGPCAVVPSDGEMMAALNPKPGAFTLVPLAESARDPQQWDKDGDPIGCHGDDL